MADDVNVRGFTPGAGSAEFVAYLLMCSIAKEKSNALCAEYSMPVIGGKDRNWVLNTYRECLHLVKHGYREQD